jgi:LmbE family N-acetylglucosaminyl deacetylase
MDAILEQPLIHGSGTSEDEWLSSGEMMQTPALALDALVPEGARMVVVAPHPDDEVLGTGALMSIAASYQRQVLIVAVTDGEGSHPAHDPRVVARIRTSERMRALWELNIRSHDEHRLGLPDGAVSLHTAVLTEALAELLRDDDVLFCPWSRDGHPDHEATAAAVKSIAKRRELTLYQVPIWGWHWCTPESFPWHKAVRFPIDPDTRQRKSRALEAFRSQIDDDLDRPILPQSTLDHFRRPFELFFRP